VPDLLDIVFFIGLPLASAVVSTAMFFLTDESK